MLHMPFLDHLILEFLCGEFQTLKWPHLYESEDLQGTENVHYFANVSFY